MRGLNTKLQTMITTCTNVTYHEAVNIAIASEESIGSIRRSRKRRVCRLDLLVEIKRDKG